MTVLGHTPAILVRPSRRTCPDRRGTAEKKRSATPLVTTAGYILDHSRTEMVKALLK